jgi:hypothetical protein
MAVDVNDSKKKAMFSCTVSCKDKNNIDPITTKLQNFKEEGMTILKLRLSTK